MVSYWKCEREHTDLRLDFKYNQHAMARSGWVVSYYRAVDPDPYQISLLDPDFNVLIRERKIEK